MDDIVLVGHDVAEMQCSVVAQPPPWPQGPPCEWGQMQLCVQQADFPCAFCPGLLGFVETLLDWQLLSANVWLLSSPHPLSRMNRSALAGYTDMKASWRSQCEPLEH
eukprot:1968522-Amphidinium_carterae.3